MHVGPQVKPKLDPIPVLTPRAKDDIFECRSDFIACAGVVELVDAGDSKSPEPKAHEGSIPSSGTIDTSHETAVPGW
jgi:hypothetical protein